MEGQVVLMSEIQGVLGYRSPPNLILGVQQEHFRSQIQYVALLQERSFQVPPLFMLAQSSS